MEIGKIKKACIKIYNREMQGDIYLETEGGNWKGMEYNMVNSVQLLNAF